MTVVDAGVGEQDHPVCANDIGRRQRQGPIIRRAVFGGNVEVESVVDRAQLLGEGIDDPEGLSDGLADIA